MYLGICRRFSSRMSEIEQLAEMRKPFTGISLWLMYNMNYLGDVLYETALLRYRFIATSSYF
jgi:hypothetical protein